MKRAGPIQPRRRVVPAAQEDAETLAQAMRLDAQRKARTIPVRVQVVFMADQQPIGVFAQDMNVPIPVRIGEISPIVIQFDAHELIEKITERLQPQPQARPSGIVVPGGPDWNAMFDGKHKV